MQGRGFGSSGSVLWQLRGEFIGRPLVCVRCCRYAATSLLCESEICGQGLVQAKKTESEPAKSTSEGIRLKKPGQQVEMSLILGQSTVFQSL